MTLGAERLEGFLSGYLVAHHRHDIPRRFDLGQIHRDFFSGHTLQERDHRQDLIIAKPDGLLIDVRHLGREELRAPDVLIVHVDVGLRLGQALIDELSRELGPDTFKVRTAAFTRAYCMAQRALAFAEKDLLPNAGQVLLVLDGGDIELLHDGRHRGQLRNTQGDQGERP